MAISDADSYHAQFRAFSGPTYKSLFLAGIVSTLSGWTAPDTGLPSGWTEITSRVHWPGGTRERLNGNVITWEADLAGENYDASLLAIGTAVVLWRRYWLPGSELITSAGFELAAGTADDGATDTFTDWTSEASDVANIIDATAYGGAYGGTHAVKIVLASSGYANAWRAATVTGGHAHSLTFYARGTTAAKAGAIVMDAADNTVLGSSATAVTTAWQRVTLNFTTPAACTGVNIVLSPDVAGTVYFDAVTLELAGDWQAWSVDYVGQFISMDDQDDYRHGQTWRRGVVGSQYDLSRLDSRPLAAGPLDVTTGSTVEAWNSDILINPVQEADSGEYVGEIASVAPANVADGRMSTVYISESIPNTTTTNMTVKVDGDVILTEVMFAPTLGWPQAATWWAEVYNCRNREGPRAFHLVTARDYDAVNMTYREATYAGGWPDKLDEGCYGIVCGNRALFEMYTGGAPNAKFVIDVSRATYEFTLDPTDGFLGICTAEHDTLGIFESPANLIWAPGGAKRRAFRGWNIGGPSYDPQDTFDSDLLPAGSGYSIRRLATPGSMTGGGDPAWFELVTEPTPGRHTTKIAPVALQVLLPENICFLTTALTTASTTVTLDNDIGWFTDGGKGIVESDVFTYTAYIVGTGLTGMTWDAGGSHDHAIGARVYPYAQIYFHDTLTWAQQTGYPLTDFHIMRRRAPVIEDGRLYLSFLREALQFDDETSQPDYDARFFWAGNTQQNQRFSLAEPDQSRAYRWVAAALIVFDKMSDGGRAKLNEIWAGVAHAQRTSSIDEDGGGVDSPIRLPASGSRSADLARYIYTLAGGVTGDFVDQSYRLGHRLGEHRISPVAITRVLNDLAQKTGCLVRYGKDGKLYWLDDPWWPLSDYVAMTEAWTSASIMGALRFGETAQTIDYVVVNALALDTKPPSQIRVTWPPPPNGATEPPVGSQAREIGGFSVVSETDARFLAESEYRKATLNAQATLTLKGIHDVQPGQLVSIVYDFGMGPAVTETWQWQIVSTELQRTMSANGRAVIQNLELRLWGKLAIA